MDVIYALVIWRFFVLLPKPEGADLTWDSIGTMLMAEWDIFLIIPLALVILIIFWLQNNEQFGLLQSSNSVHASLSIAQLFLVLVFFYAIATGLRFDGGSEARVLESTAALLLGLASFLSWHYASRTRNLLQPDVSRDEVNRLWYRNMSEPLTAAITIPFAFAGPISWELSWFLYPLIRYLFNRIYTLVRKP